jgi:hypothetical protein
MSESIEANINATVFPSTLNQGINLAKKSTVATFTAIDMKKRLSTSGFGVSIFCIGPIMLFIHARRIATTIAVKYHPISIPG